MRRRLPDIPRCTMSEPVSRRISKYFARRSTATTCWPRTAISSFAAMGQRKRRSRTITSMTRCPISAGAMPRRVVSTSGSSGSDQAELFDLRFFVSDVLAHHRIEFLRLELVRVQALIFGGRVVVTGAGGGNQFDLVAHEQPLKP